MRRPIRRLVAGLVAVAAGIGGAAAAGDLDAAIGFRLFKRAWVPAPASTGADDGLGPLYNARSCLACHGQLARAPALGDDALDHGVVLRLGDAAGHADPRFGAQIQTAATAGVPVEAEVRLGWTATADGLARRLATVTAPVDPAPTTHLSLRTAPALTLAGAIAAVDDAAILAVAKASVSGRLARLGDGRIGRFGWKASEASLGDFTARAFAVDMGLSTPARPRAGGDCTAAQTACLESPGGWAPDGKPEIDQTIVDAIARFLATRPRPAPAPDPRGTGARLFAGLGCVACHVPALAARDGGEVMLYSDLLLHNLGSGLDDGVGEGAAGSAEWRTAPLSGLGAARGKGLLHDGRARDIDEAIRWHGGAASAARAGYGALRPAERRALIGFLESL